MDEAQNNEGTVRLYNIARVDLSDLIGAVLFFNSFDCFKAVTAI